MPITALPQSNLRQVNAKIQAQIQGKIRHERNISNSWPRLQRYVHGHRRSACGPLFQFRGRPYFNFYSVKILEHYSSI